MMMIDIVPNLCTYEKCSLKVNILLCDLCVGCCWYTRKTKKILVNEQTKKEMIKLNKGIWATKFSLCTDIYNMKNESHQHLKYSNLF